VVRSLNLGVRKKETERIEHENHAFAKRLFEKTPNVDHKRLEDDHRAQLKFKNQLLKVELPPISSVHSRKNSKKQRSQHRRLNPLNTLTSKTEMPTLNRDRDSSLTSPIKTATGDHEPIIEKPGSNSVTEHVTEHESSLI